MRDGTQTSGDAATCSGNGNGAAVVVGMKMDKRSRELLTWTLVNVAQNGDRVVALHVVDPESDKSILLALMKNFASVLDAYEGFCNLKQVDLKFKVRKGSPARKILAAEAKSCGATALIVGASSVNRRIRSSILVAEYCAKSLPKSISVICVDNSKVVFQRSVDAWFSRGKIEPKVKILLPKSSESENVDMDLVPFKKQNVMQSKSRWGLLHSLLYVAQRAFGISSAKKASMAARLVTRLPIEPRGSVVYPVRKQITASEKDESPLHYGFCYMKPTEKNLLDELNAIRDKFSTTCRLFSYQELQLATKNFGADNLIGKGGSSMVYRGCVQGGEMFAVKILKPSKGVLEQFVSEVEILTSIHHENIICLAGLCVEAKKLLLVYSLLSRGSLEENLHGAKKDKGVFGWKERYKVAVGVAKALDRLHNIAEPIVHRDVKSSNILLSDDFEAQLSDFGLATRASSSSHCLDVMEVAGTFGYLAPEYFFHGKVSEKIDVYAFGVVLLELMSSRKPVDCELPKGQESLVMWAKRILLEGKISELWDPELVNDPTCNSDQFELMAMAASLCIRSSPQARPGINMVLKLLQNKAEVVQWARQERRQTRDGTDHDDNDVVDPLSASEIQSFLDLALLNLDDDSESSCSTEQNISVERYLGTRQSCFSS